MLLTLLATAHHLLCQSLVCRRRFAVGVVGIDALALGAGFRCFDGKGYLRLEYAKLISVTITKQRRNLLCKVRAVIHHCEQSALDFEVGIDVLFDAVDGL